MEIEYVHPIAFDDAVKTITDPDYGIGVINFWQLPPDWAGTKTAKIHDLRYDYLKPGENTFDIDHEALNGWRIEDCSMLQYGSFYVIIRAWGSIFEEGVHICELTGNHCWKKCSYGQAGKIYDMRCSICGLHKELVANELLINLCHS